MNNQSHEKFEYTNKLTKELEFGQKVKDFMGTDMWAFINDYINASVAGLNDISSIDIFSENKTQAEIIGRKHAKAYIEALKYHLESQVQQGEIAEHELKRLRDGVNQFTVRR